MNIFIDTIIGDTFTTKKHDSYDDILQATDDTGKTYPMLKKHVLQDLDKGRIAICVGKEFRVRRNGRWQTFNKGETQ